MKLKNSEVLPALLAANALAEVKLPARGAFKVRKLHRALKQAWDDVQAVQKSLFEQYAKKDEKGAPMKGEPINGEETILLTDEGKEAFHAAWKELMAVEVEIADTLAISDFGDVMVEPGHLIGLGDLLTEN